MPRSRTYHREYEAILRADPCCYCGRPMKHVDHITPVADGGDDGWENLTAACRRCNQQKNHETLWRFLWRRRMADEYPPQPAKGVRLRRDTLMWNARAYAANRVFILGDFDTPAQALAAIDGWKRSHLHLQSARQQRQAARYPVIQRMWAAGATLNEIGAELGISLKAVDGCMRDMRNKGIELPRSGRGGPGKPRPSRAGIKVGAGYRYIGPVSNPWLVQVQRKGERFTARVATEDEAQRVAAAFRAGHVITV